MLILDKILIALDTFKYADVELNFMRECYFGL